MCDISLSEVMVTKEFFYTINEDNGYNIRIVFVNNRFNRVDFNFTGSYTREQWEILAKIEKEICKIEKQQNEYDINKDYINLVFDNNRKNNGKQ